MKFSVDEWGVWAVPSNTVNNELNEEPWQIAPAISEQIYTLEDALLFAEMQENQTKRRNESLKKRRNQNDSRHNFRRSDFRIYNVYVSNYNFAGLFRCIFSVLRNLFTNQTQISI